MLDSIKATLTRLLGPESARVVEFYVDRHLALEDPVAFEEALTSFLGSKAGEILIEAIKMDLLTESGKSMPEQVARFLNAPPPSRLAQSASTMRPVPPEERGVGQQPGPQQEHFIRTMQHAKESGMVFSDAVTERLVASQGETRAYATLACIGRKALVDPGAFADRVMSLFGLQGALLLESLSDSSEKGSQRAPVRPRP